MTDPIKDITHRLGGRSMGGVTVLALMSLTACAGVDESSSANATSVDKGAVQFAAAEPTTDAQFAPSSQLAQVQPAQQGKTRIDAGQEGAVSDPLEPWNRYVFSVNDVVYTFARPWIAPYMVLPQEGKDTVDNFLHNLTSPVILVNDLLQGEFDRAWTTTKRFAINSTSGVLGLIDVAEDYGMAKHDEDFGQTLGTYGVGDSPYLVLPLLGPSNPRDGIGRGVDTITDPLFWVGTTAISAGRMYGTFSNEYGGHVNEMDSLRETSLDYYATMRSLYTQMRRAKVKNIETPDSEEANIDYFSHVDDPN